MMFGEAQIDLFTGGITSGDGFKKGGDFIENILIEHICLLELLFPY